MPEMTDAMYCHQQICVPPTFPYLLRQYAKAAIRSQPSDLLRWSCAYFRSLSLGLHPPMKIRLEYPIPRTHFGLTPGWLKTLLYQLSGNTFVTWPVLYDRWRGACLQIEGLQEIILLAGFSNPVRIPWLQFVACAAGHLTTNLTNTMILICELLTEEPEGGSASIPYHIFADLYKFLAYLDACEEHEVRNIWFTESNLDLTKVAPDEGSTRFEELQPSLATEVEEEEYYIKDRYEDLQKYLKAIEVAEVEEDIVTTPKASTEVRSEAGPATPEPTCYIILDPEDGKICDEVHSKTISSSSESSTEPFQATTEVTAVTVGEEASEEQTYQVEASEVSKMESVSSTISSSESSKAVQIFKLVAVPGIGGVVSDEIVEAVLKYMREVANKQKGMVMPRNIKHFMCPPLEECYD